MQSIEIDILNKRALNLLRELESLKLIRLRETGGGSVNHSKDLLAFKGAMRKEPIESVERQLKELRGEWH